MRLDVCPGLAIAGVGTRTLGRLGLRIAPRLELAAARRTTDT